MAHCGEQQHKLVPVVADVSSLLGDLGQQDGVLPRFRGLQRRVTPTQLVGEYENELAL